MDKQNYEKLVESFARRWLPRESDAMREIFERELAEVLRSASNKQPN